MTEGQSRATEEKTKRRKARAEQRKKDEVTEGQSRATERKDEVTEGKGRATEKRRSDGRPEQSDKKENAK
ncbi:hypothetical protein PVA17_19295 [Lysinibacillus sp. CNPSo 3705]|uniref:hypothetical protein n=1 Tax=Lysinibacillus sp. CNPSo 3705 TaxID=3028148 RepID=UPI002363F063|nr:hypothetical protein [Lysinibacillus sp. CNPSo 3705]MDD1504888.1 hypothetical protein [Lysinibacillus sp. CNPSo 3705]